MRHKNKFLAWVMAGVVIMGLTGCAAAEENEIIPQDNSGYENSESETTPAVITTAMPNVTMSTTTTEQTTTTTAVIEEISTTAEIPVIEKTSDKIFPDQIEPDFSPLELLGYHIDDNGDIYIDFNWDNPDPTCDPELYRKYFFGSWNGWYQNRGGKLIIDDSQKNNFPSWLTGAPITGIYIRNNIIFSLNDGQAGLYINWLNIEEPNIMYYEVVYKNKDKNGLYIEYNFNKPISYKILTMTKTSEPIYEPENGFLSRLRLIELSNERDIDIDMLTDYFFMSDDGVIFQGDGRYVRVPIYLIYDSPKKIILKSEVYDISNNKTLNVLNTINYNNFTWERIV